MRHFMGVRGLSPTPTPTHTHTTAADSTESMGDSHPLGHPQSCQDNGVIAAVATGSSLELVLMVLAQYVRLYSAECRTPGYLCLLHTEAFNSDWGWMAKVSNRLAMLR